MKHLTILIPDGQSTLSSIACRVGTSEMFTIANEYWKQNDREELFTIELAGVSEKTEFGNGTLTVKPDTHISAVTKTDLIIIPSLIRDFQEGKKN